MLRDLAEYQGGLRLVVNTCLILFTSITSDDDEGQAGIHETDFDGRW